MISFWHCDIIVTRVYSCLLLASSTSILVVNRKEVKKATENFSSELLVGKGGFGCVYRGYMRCTTVAIKVLTEVSNILTA